MECGGAGGETVEESGVGAITDQLLANMAGGCSSERDDLSGGFEVKGDKTKFATLQRQRKQLYDELRDSKCRAQVRERENAITKVDKI